MANMTDKDQQPQPAPPPVEAPVEHGEPRPSPSNPPDQVREFTSQKGAKINE